jgi:hypothetical protein
MPLIFLMACAAPDSAGSTSIDTGELDCTLGRDAVWITVSDPDGRTLAFNEFDGEFRARDHWFTFWNAGVHFGENSFHAVARRAFDLGPGPYEIVLWADGYEGWEGVLDVEDAEDGQLITQMLHLTLEPAP